LRDWCFGRAAWTPVSLPPSFVGALISERKGFAPVSGFRNEIPLAAIDSVEIARGKRFDSHRATRTILAGIGLGAALGVIAGSMSGPGEDGRGVDELAAVYLGTLGALGGGVVGAIVGSQRTTVRARVRIP
jgi:hypothetical protein